VARVLMSGNSVIGEAAIRAGCQCYFGYPITPAIFIIMSVWMMTYTLIERPFESLFGIITILAGIPFYIIFTKKNKKINQKT